MSGFFSQVLLTQPVESLLKRGKKEGWSGLRQVPKNSSNSAEGLEVSNSDEGLEVSKNSSNSGEGLRMGPI